MAWCTRLLISMGEDKIFAICNCCVCSCYALRTSQLFNTPNMSRSAYIARVNTENCVACGQCVEYCPSGAARLGQKLCTKSGPVSYPMQELPDAVKWGPEKWNENYRDDNQINCYDTGTAPCKTNCPAHIAVQGYINMASQGRYLDALKLIKKEIHSRQFAEVSATAAVKMLAPAGKSTRQWQSMRSRSLLPCRN